MRFKLEKSHFFKGSPIFYRLGGEGLSIFGGSVLSGGTKGEQSSLMSIKEGL